MDNPKIIQSVSSILKITEEEATNILNNSFGQTDPFNYLVDLLGYSNIELIFEIFKNKNSFDSKEIKNEQALFIEHIIPEIETTKSSIELIKTSVLGDDSKFFSYKEFNQLQSAVFDNIYKSDENILVSAPTGAGKTDIALLSILRALKSPNSQIIYIVPMKALANEICSKYRRVFSDSIKIIEYTGDTEIDQKTAASARIVICTPEKYDSSTRRLCGVFESVKLIVIDEIHLLEDDRGPVLESIVARSFVISELQQSKIRIVGLSATLPNYKDVAEFIKAKHTHFFDSKYRPVPLKMTITGFTKISEYQDEKNYLIEKVQEYLNMNKQVIIFVSSRAKTFKTAHFLMENLPKMKTEIDRRMNLSGDLLSLVAGSFGIHNAGLLRKDRLIMENLFREGKIRILVCTSTLAWGVNLPAYAVIIHGSTYYNSIKGTFDDISILDVLQIFGRAGRPQYDTKGEAILMTSSDKIDKYITLLKRSEDIESKMLYSFPETLNSEIYLGNINSISSALVWIKNTFLYVRVMKNPAKYGIIGSDLGLEEQALSEYIYLTINLLEDCGLIKVEKKDTNYNTWIFESTIFGQITSIYYLNHLTMFNWLKDIQLVTDEFSLIKLLLKSKEFECVSVRKDEIGYLNNIHQEMLLDSIIDFEFDETTESKLLVLFISFLMFKKMPIFSLSCDIEFLIDNMKRLISAMKVVLLSLEKFELFDILFNLEKKVCRFKKQKMIDCEINCKRINGDYIELEIKHNQGLSTVFVSEKSKIIDVLLLKGNSRQIIACKSNSIAVAVHSNEKWLVYETNLKIKPDYSIKGLFTFGTHCCERTFNLNNLRSPCDHFLDLDLSQRFEKTVNLKESGDKQIKKDQHEKSSAVLSINRKNISKYISDSIETFGNLIDIHYSLHFTFKSVDSLYFKERLKAASLAIDKMDLEEALIVCPNPNDAKETHLFLNTKAALSKKNIIGKYGIGPKPNSKFWICTFREAFDIKGFGTVIFKSASDPSGLYRIGDIFEIADRRNAVIFETPKNIEFLKSIYQ